MHIISCCTILFILICRTIEDDENHNPVDVTAVSGLCALISCTFIHPEKGQLQTVQENMCNNQTECKTIPEIQNKGRKIFGMYQIKLLEPDVTKYNCSSIKEIKEDETEFVFTIERHGQTSQSSVNIIIQDEPIMNIPPLSEGEKADLTCSANFPCPETPNITWWIRTRGGHSTYLKDNITLSTSKNLSTLTLTPTSDLHNATVGCNMSYGIKNISTNRTIKVTSVKNPIQVMEGGILRLNCTVESHPPSSDPVWSFNGTTDIFMNQTFAGSFMITNVTEEHAGVYSCMRTFQNKTLNTSITININCFTTESKGNKSSSPKGIIDFLKNWDIPKIVTFVAGMVCSALIFSVVLCCCVSCHRGKKHKVPITNPDTEVNLEMVQTDTAQTGTNEETPLQGQLNGGNPNTTGATDGAEEDEAVRMEGKEVDYASIDYSLLKDRPPEEEEKEPTDTDYAEIKKDKIGDGKQKEVLQDGDDQIETQDQMEGEETRYSNSEELKI